MTKPRNPVTASSVLSLAFDWELLVDVQKKLKFPEYIAVTLMRPDMLLLSQATKAVHVVELTVPWEDRLDISYELKAAKYQDLVDEVRIKVWNVSLMPTEVGSWLRGETLATLRYLLMMQTRQPSC